MRPYGSSNVVQLFLQLSWSSTACAPRPKSFPHQHLMLERLLVSFLDQNKNDSSTYDSVLNFPITA